MAADISAAAGILGRPAYARWLMVLAVVGAISAAGCSNERSPAPGSGVAVTTGAEETSTRSPATSPRSTTEGATSPPGTGATPKVSGDLASAFAFPKTLVGQVNLAFRTSSREPLASVLTAGCTGCEGLVAALDRTIARQLRTTGDVWSLATSNVLSWEPGKAVVLLAITQNPVDLVDSSGTRVDDMARGAYRYHITIDWRAGWRVTDWLRVNSS